MNVLGVSAYYHDAAAALVADGRIVAAAEEERFTRRKHDSRFPTSAIAWALADAGLGVDDLDFVCFYEKPFRKLERLLACGRQTHPKSAALVRQQLARTAHERLWVDRVLEQTIGYTGRVGYVEHHLAHAASAYYVSGFADAVILTVDGVGEWATTAHYRGSGGAIEKIREIHYPDSLGLFYSTFTAFLGFTVNNDEYKVMGLASYGTPTEVDKVRRVIALNDDGSFGLSREHFSFAYDKERMYSDAFVELFGPPRPPGDPITAEHANLAASVQQVLEEAMVGLVSSCYEPDGPDALCLAGGVALNCVANTRLIDATPFRRFAIQPAAGDGGGALGAALYAQYAMAPETFTQSGRHTTLLGPAFSDEAICDFLDARGVSYERPGEDELCRQAAELVHQGQILGWFQGRMEFGPRALGSRSIVANPCRPEMKDVLNRRVKFREDFRPFAPAVLAEHAGDYFECPFESPHMLFVAPVRAGKRNVIPSVTHTDGTARLQTVTREEQPRFYRLIEQFGRLSGVPAVINTSFNVRGEPIVCTPEDAYHCFMKTDIDALVMGDALVTKAW